MGKRKVWKILIIILIALVAVCVVTFVVGIKSYMSNDNEAKAAMPGNGEEYAPENVTPLDNSPLRGKKILFLGSSVTYGAAAQGCSFADYIGKLDGAEITKEAVSATTLVDEFSIFAFLGYGDGRSYVTRLNKVDKKAEFDAVVVQLSTNDATMGKPLGEISSSDQLSDFDTKTVTGAMEYIIAYVQKTWGCPVVFYTGSYYESEAYSAMVNRLLELQEKWDVHVIDLYNDAELNSIDEETYNFYMFDKIHPNKAGYLKWWTPAIQKGLPFAMAWWHNLCAGGTDMFGRDTADKSFGAEKGTMEHAKHRFFRFVYLPASPAEPISRPGCSNRLRG